MLKKVKKILIYGLMLSMLLGNTAMAAPSKKAVKKAYASYVKKKLSSTSKYPYGDYTLYDINRDGIPEMFFEYMAGVRSGFKIYTYRKGKVKALKSTTGISCIYCNSRKKQICILYSSGAANNQYIAYKMQGRKLRRVSVYESKAVNGYMWDVRFYKNGKTITQEQFSTYTSGIDRWKRITTQ